MPTSSTRSSPLQIMDTTTCLKQLYKSIVKRITPNRSHSFPYSPMCSSAASSSISSSSSLDSFPMIQRVHHISFTLPLEIAYADRLCKGHRRWIQAQREIESKSRVFIIHSLSPPDDLPSFPVLASRLETQIWQRTAFQYLIDQHKPMQWFRSIELYETILDRSPLLYSTQRRSLKDAGGAPKMVCKRAIAMVVQCRISENRKELWSEYSTLMYGYELMQSTTWNRCIDETLPSCDCWCCSALYDFDETSSKALGTLLHQGVILPQDYKLARVLYLHAFRRGIAAAGNSLGFMSQHGHGILLSDKQAMNWYEKAAYKGCATAQYNMGCIYFHNAWNNDGTKTKPNQLDPHNAKMKSLFASAVEWYSLAARQGDPDACGALGDHYMEGLGVERDLRLALHFHLLAARKGHTISMLSVGNHLYFGRDSHVNRDLPKALLWYRCAATRGNALAMYSLGHMYWFAQGVDAPQRAQAAYWLSKAAQLGVAEAQYRLATIFERGSLPIASNPIDPSEKTFFAWIRTALQRRDELREDGTNNMEQQASNVQIGLAVYWYKHAVRSNHERAQNRLDNLAQSDGTSAMEHCKTWSEPQVKARESALLLALHSRAGDSTFFTKVLSDKDQKTLFDHRLIPYILSMSQDALLPADPRLIPVDREPPSSWRHFNADGA